MKPEPGVRWGQLVVLRVVRRDKHGFKMVKCQCACGTEKVIRWQSAPQRAKSCGCLIQRISVVAARARNLKPLGEANFNSLFQAYSTGARNRGLIFQLTKDQFRILTKNKCHYCGTEPQRPYDKSSRSTSKRLNGAYLCNGIDRVDNNEGYTVANCVACCSACNVAKGSSSKDHFLKWAIRVVLHSVANSMPEKNAFYNLVNTAQKFAPTTAEQPSAVDQVKFGLAAVNRTKEDDKRLAPEPEAPVHRPAYPIPN
jgi:hypothetical protein